MAKGTGLVRKVLGGAVQAPGVVAGFATGAAVNTVAVAGAATAGVVGGAVKNVGKGFIKGVKASGKVKRKILGEATEAVAKGADDAAEAAAKGASDVAEEAADKVGSGFFDKAISKWDGLPNWAKTAGIGTAGLIAGGMMFGDDDDE